MFFHLGHIIFVWVCWLHSKGWSLRCSLGWGNPHSCVVMLYVGEGSKREQCHLLSSQLAFSHFFCYPQANWVFLVLIPTRKWVCVHSRTLWVSPINSPVRWGVSPATETPTSFLYQRFWSFMSLYWNPGLCSLFRSPVFPPGPSLCKCGTTHSTSHCSARSSSSRLAMSPLYPGCLSPPLLSVWMNVSSLTPWLSDFHTVRVSGSSGYVLFWSLLLSFFWL